MILILPNYSSSKAIYKEMLSPKQVALIGTPKANYPEAYLN